MEIGKLPNDVLERIIFDNIKNKRDEVLVGSAIGEDNAIIDFGEDICILSTDPITGASKDIGHLAVHISCNDVASSGGEPIALLLTILAPPTTSEEELRTIMRDASLASKEVNVEIAGGHTEITDAVNQIVLSTTVIGRQKKSKMIDKSRVEEGDIVCMSKTVAIEGTSILAKELEEELRTYLTEEELAHAQSMDKKLSVLEEGRLAGELGVDYMHDITEGGLLGAVWEAGQSIGKGIEIWEDRIAIDEVSVKLSKILEVDPYKLISSGSMLMILKKDKIGELRDKMLEKNILLSQIGQVKGEELYLVKEGSKQVISAPGSDELYRALRFFD